MGDMGGNEAPYFEAVGDVRADGSNPRDFQGTRIPVKGLISLWAQGTSIVVQAQLDDCRGDYVIIPIKAEDIAAVIKKGGIILAKAT